MIARPPLPPESSPGTTERTDDKHAAGVAVEVPSQAKVLDAEDIAAVAAERAVGAVLPDPLGDHRHHPGERLPPGRFALLALADGLHGIVGRHGPQALARLEVDRPEGAEVAHQHQAVDDQRMQSGEDGFASLLVVLPPLAEGILDGRGMLHVLQGGHAPAHAQQRRAAGGRHVAGRVAAKHQPAIGAGGLARPWRARQPRQPGHRIGVLVEPGNLPPADAQLQHGPLLFQAHQGPLRLLRRPRFQPAGGHGQRQCRLEARAAVRRVAQTPQRQRPGQRQAVIQIV